MYDFKNSVKDVFLADEKRKTTEFLAKFSAFSEFEQTYIKLKNVSYFEDPNSIFCINSNKNRIHAEKERVKNHCEKLPTRIFNLAVKKKLINEIPLNFGSGFEYLKNNITEQDFIKFIFSGYNQRVLKVLNQYPTKNDFLKINSEFNKLFHPKSATFANYFKTASYTSKDFYIEDFLAKHKDNYAIYLKDFCSYIFDEYYKKLIPTVLKERKKREDFLNKYINLSLDERKKLVDEATKKGELLPAYKILYKKIVNFLASKGIKAPFKNELESGAFNSDNFLIASLYLKSDKFFIKALTRLEEVVTEHINIFQGRVSKKSSPYISKWALQNYKAKQKRAIDFANNSFLVNVDDLEDVLIMQDVIKSSLSNPFIRRAELMTRIRGVEEYAESEGLTGIFLTLTAPSKYHAEHNCGGAIEKTGFYTPKQTQEYLINVWARIRAKLKRRDINPIGVRVVEPHHDGTPHWHLLLFLERAKMVELVNICKSYALAEDGDELGAREYRFKFKTIKKSKGSASGYIAKYVAKNIDGFSTDDSKSDSANIDFSDNAVRSRAWASLWNIRQFQFIGTPPISVYREMRRAVFLNLVDVTENDIFNYCDQGDFNNYIRLQGGINTKKIDYRYKSVYEAREPNEYGVVSQKLTGFKDELSGAETLTHVKTFEIYSLKQMNIAPFYNFFMKNEKELKGFCPSWTCVNNCTLDKKQPDIDRETYKMEVIKAILDLQYGIEPPHWFNQALTNFQNNKLKT